MRIQDVLKVAEDMEDIRRAASTTMRLLDVDAEAADAVAALLRVTGGPLLTRQDLLRAVLREGLAAMHAEATARLRTQLAEPARAA